MTSVIFDLDGTLIDSLDDIASALNHVLAKNGMPTHERDAVERLVGHGMRALVAGAIPEGADEDAMLEQYRAHYTAHLTDHTHVYDGVVELLAALEAADVKMAVLSNKPHAMTRQAVDELFGSERFVDVFGQRDDVPKKPDPAGALELAQRLPKPIYFVGDTDVDMQTAKAAGQHAVGVKWGMRDEQVLRDAGAEVVLGHPRELMGVLGR